MTIVKNYSGYLLAAHPSRAGNHLNQSVIFVFKHDRSGAIGLQINRPFYGDTNLGTVMENLGIYADFSNEPLYVGGEVGSNRVYVLHSLDWFSSSTLKFDNDLGVSGDVSVISAISQNQGPDQYRAVAGYVVWPPGMLEEELESVDPETSWIAVPAEAELVFDHEGNDQWKQVLIRAGQYHIDNWFAV